eukprot:scaffold489504_cov29-Prasinocladus_malaysianus.AAC.1
MYNSDQEVMYIPPCTGRGRDAAAAGGPQGLAVGEVPHGGPPAPRHRGQAGEREGAHQGPRGG